MSAAFPLPIQNFGLDNRTCYLVVDDLETMRKATVNQLRQLGAENIFTAKDGNEALRVIRNQRVDIVVSDWNMPGMTGIELLRSLRSDPRTANLPFLMVTAEAERLKIEEAIQAGVDSMLIKPYSSNQLAQRVERALTRKIHRPVNRVKPPEQAVAQAQSAQVAPSVATRPKGAPTILCVDDTPDNLALLFGLLKDDYRVQSAKDGTKALQICFSDTPPDLVLLDIMMPGMDGFEVARRMREHPNAETIPVIFVTGMDSNEAHQKGLALGAVDFITKPIDPVMLKSRVRNFMRYVDLRRDLQAQYDGMVEMGQLRDDVEHITRHDLKGPLAGIISIAQGLLHGGGLDSEKLGQIKLLEEAALQTLNMVNLSSELFKIETGRFILSPKSVPIADILNRTIELARSTNSEKNLRISMIVQAAQGGLAPLASGDAMLCYSLFQNLIKNACEAAPSQGKVLVRLIDQSPLAIVIENDGAVPVDFRERFFDKHSTSGNARGAGLGAYSAKLLAQAQGGSITLDVSDANNTTSVTVKLPALKVGT